jgi:hypothetical protein
MKELDNTILSKGKRHSIISETLSYAVAGAAKVLLTQGACLVDKLACLDIFFSHGTYDDRTQMLVSGG